MFHDIQRSLFMFRTFGDNKGIWGNKSHVHNKAHCVGMQWALWLGCVHSTISLCNNRKKEEDQFPHFLMSFCFRGEEFEDESEIIMKIYHLYLMLQLFLCISVYLFFIFCWSTNLLTNIGSNIDGPFGHSSSKNTTDTLATAATSLWRFAVSLETKTALVLDCWLNKAILLSIFAFNGN